MPANVKASRGWKFVIPLDPDNFSDVVRYGDYKPPPFPPKMQVRFAVGQAQFSLIQPESETAERNVEFAGYLESKVQISQFQVQNWHRGAFLSPVDIKDRELAIKEVSDTFREIKGDSLVKWGVGDASVAGQGHRTDFDDIKDILKNDGPIAGVKRVAEEFPTHFVRYHAGIQRLADVVEALPKDDQFKPNPFQKAMIEELSQEPHPRHIYWVYDKAGHSGKSRLAKYLQCEMGAIELAGREVDIAYGYNSQRIVIFDIPRATPLTNYTEAFVCAERLKNGGIFSSKFGSKFKRFHTPHIIFLSNQAPPTGVWTEDRLQLITIDAPPEQPFHPFTNFNAPQPAPVYVPTRADLINDRMKQLAAEKENDITCHACLNKKTAGHTYKNGCQFNTEGIEEEFNND